MIFAAAAQAQRIFDVPTSLESRFCGIRSLPDGPTHQYNGISIACASFEIEQPACSRDEGTFDKRHRNDVVVQWPAQPPTHGRHDHRAESIRLFQTFPDNRVHNRPYRVLFASGDWTCSIARFTGTMTGPMAGPNGNIPPTGKSFEVDFCTVAHWDHAGQIIEENLFYDVVGLMQQVGAG